MKILLIGHERSLNKCELFFTLFPEGEIHLITDRAVNLEDKWYCKNFDSITVIPDFNIIAILQSCRQPQKVYTVSENLLPVVAAVEKHWEITNLSSLAASVLSNKQALDDYCRLIGLGDYVPDSFTPRSPTDLHKITNKPIFTKPDIGTGSNVFFPDDDKEKPSIEYRRWKSVEHFKSFLFKTDRLEEFLDMNETGIRTKRFNYMASRLMIQEYFPCNAPSFAPLGYVKNGKVYVLVFIRNSKIDEYTDVRADSSPIQSHDSAAYKTVRERAVWSLQPHHVPTWLYNRTLYFLQTLISSLQINDMFFAGPDFHYGDDYIKAIDFNPRPGQLINILANFQKDEFYQIYNNDSGYLSKMSLWGATTLQPGIIDKVHDTSTVLPYLNKHNTGLKPGVVIPKFQNLQSKAFNLAIKVTGLTENDLFDKYKAVNNKLQNLIIYR